MNDLSTRVALTVAQNAPAAARQWPCFVGPTGAGKTARAAAIAAALNRQLHVLLPGTSLPEDLLGLPAVKAGVTNWTVPEWARSAASVPSVILIDELDKARPETHGALLTMLSSLQVRDVHLHKDTIFIAAMQPVDRAEWLSTETGRALSARLCFVPVAYDRARTAAAWGCDAAALAAAAGEEPAPQPPTLPVISDRQLEALAALFAATKDSEVRKAIAAGIAGERGQALLELWESGQRAAVAPEDVARALIDEPSLVESMSVPELVALAPHALIHGTPEVLARVCEEIGKRGTREDWAKAIESLSPGVDAAAGGADEVYVFRGSAGVPPEKIVDGFVSAVGGLVDRLNGSKR